MNCSTPGLPVHHKLPEFTQTHAHRVGDAIQPSHPLLSPSPPAPNPSQHQGLFQWVNSLPCNLDWINFRSSCNSRGSNQLWFIKQLRNLLLGTSCGTRRLRPVWWFCDAKGLGAYCVALPSLGCFPYVHLMHKSSSQWGGREGNQRASPFLLSVQPRDCITFAHTFS